VPNGRTRAYNLGSLASAKRHAVINTKKQNNCRKGSDLL